MTERATHERRPGRSSAEGDRTAWTVWGPLALLALVGFAVTFFFLEPPPPERFSIATGTPGGAYHQFAERYREVLAEQGYELEIVETRGSTENLEALRRGEVDLALVQGGVGTPTNSDGVEAVASVFLEAVWILHRSELALDGLEDLEGRRVSIGPPGSGTRPLALSLLSDHGLDESRVDLVDLGPAESREALLDGRLDALILVSSANAPWLAPLLGDPTVRLLPVERQRAYAVRHRFLTPVTLGRGVLDLRSDLPAEDVPLVAAAASLATRPDLPSSLVPLLVETLKTVHESGGLLEKPGDFPSPRWTDLPLMSEARHYLERGPSFLYRILPFWAAAMADRLKILLLPLITLLIPVVKAAPPLYRWRIRSKIYRWYEDLKAVDDALLDASSRADLDERIQRLEAIEREVISEVSVPLSYMDELYRLREHIHLVLAQLVERREETETDD